MICFANKNSLQRQLFPFHFKVNMKRKTFRVFFLQTSLCKIRDTGMKVRLYMCTRVFSVLNQFLIQKRWEITLNICTKSTSYLRGGNSQ